MKNLNPFVENSLEYYMLHEKGYTFGSGNMSDLTPLQVRYMLKAQEIENEHMEKKKEERKLTKKGKPKNVNNSGVKNKLKDKYKNRTNRGG